MLPIADLPSTINPQARFPVSYTTVLLEAFCGDFEVWNQHELELVWYMFWLCLRELFPARDSCAQALFLGPQHPISLKQQNNDLKWSVRSGVPDFTIWYIKGICPDISNKLVQHFIETFQLIQDKETLLKYLTGPAVVDKATPVAYVEIKRPVVFKSMFNKFPAKHQDWPAHVENQQKTMWLAATSDCLQYARMHFAKYQDSDSIVMIACVGGLFTWTIIHRHKVKPLSADEDESFFVNSGAESSDSADAITESSDVDDREPMENPRPKKKRKLETRQSRCVCAHPRFD
jgi:hypothetical protein